MNVNPVCGTPPANSAGWLNDSFEFADQQQSRLIDDRHLANHQRAIDDHRRSFGNFERRFGKSRHLRHQEQRLICSLE
jgi:hypothetical protein